MITQIAAAKWAGKRVLMKSHGILHPDELPDWHRKILLETER
jgi:hypothetical protein